MSSFLVMFIFVMFNFVPDDFQIFGNMIFMISKCSVVLVQVLSVMIYVFDVKLCF